MPTLDKAVDQYSWMKLGVAAVIQYCWPAHMIQTRSEDSHGADAGVRCGGECFMQSFIHAQHAT